MKTVIYLTLILTFSISSKAAIANFQKDQGKIIIMAVGNPSALKIKGEGSGPTGSVDFTNQDLKGDLEFNLDSLETGIKLRNEHMKKKYLQTETYPRAILKILKIDSKGQDLNKDFELANTKFEGILNLHGVEKPVTGVVTLNKNASTLDIKANFKIDIKDFSIETPSFAGITVTEEVAVNVESKATIQQ